MKPVKTSIGGLLNEYQRLPLRLPEYQRSYSWENTQIATFWGDLKAFSERYSQSPTGAEYFLGPVVLIESKTEITVLDGQQRLATATVLLSALRNIATELNSVSPSQDLHDFSRDIQRELIEKKDSKPLLYSLALGDLDESYFLQKIKQTGSSNLKPLIRSHQLISRSYGYLYAQINNEIAGKNPANALLGLKAIKDALTKGMHLVAIYVEDEEAACDVFETLNDRGLRLSVPDLVLNLLLKRCSDKASRHSVRQMWIGMIQQMGQKDISKFLRHFWLSQYGDLKAKGLYAEIKSHLNTQKVTSTDFAQLASEACDDYLKLLEISKTLPKDALTNIEGMVRYFNAQNSLPLLLAAYQCMSASDFTKLVKAATTVYVRHTLICNLNPLELESAFYEAARDIRANFKTKVASAKILSSAKAILKKLDIVDAEVAHRFEDLILSRSEASWFVTQLANSQQSNTKEIGMDKANVEHIFPQNAGVEWPNRAALEPLIWHVGNLTILGTRINAKAKNKAFNDKCKDNYASSEIVMTKDLLKESTWDEAVIRKRAKLLAKIAVTKWK